MAEINPLQIVRIAFHATAIAQQCQSAVDALQGFSQCNTFLQAPRARIMINAEQPGFIAQCLKALGQLVEDGASRADHSNIVRLSGG